MDPKYRHQSPYPQQNGSPIGAPPHNQSRFQHVVEPSLDEAAPSQGHQPQYHHPSGQPLYQHPGAQAPQSPQAPRAPQAPQAPRAPQAQYRPPQPGHGAPPHYGEPHQGGQPPHHYGMQPPQHHGMQAQPHYGAPPQQGGASRGPYRSPYGAPQYGGPPQGESFGRNVFLLILVGFGWMVVMWIVSLVFVGMVAGALNPHNAEEAGGRAGELFSIPALLVSLIASIIFTALGKLPGSGYPKSRY